MTKQKKNLLFLFTDQQRHDTLSVGGNDKIKVPYLNRLAEESVVFTQAYVTQPVCTPSRGTIMTGLYPHNHRATNNNMPLTAEIPTIAELSNDPDYRTGYVGKWHLGDEIFAQHGFETWSSIDDMYREQYSEDRDRSEHSHYYHYLRAHGIEPDQQSEDGFRSYSRGYCARLPEEFSKPAFVGREAARFIRNHKDDPFILYVNFFEPHTPNFSQFDDVYGEDDIDLPPCYDKSFSADVPLKCQLNQRYYREKIGLDSEEKWRKKIARYWGQITLVDKYVGVILAALKEHGLEEDTVVVFTSDHGDMMGDFRMMTKMVMFQSAVRVPFMIKIPGAQGMRKEIGEPVSLVDIVPTLCDIMGWRTDRSFDGKSLYPAMKGEQDLSNNYVFIEWNGSDSDGTLYKTYRPELPQQIERVSGASIRTIVTPDGWKMNLSEAGEHELYHLATDPCETNNLYFQGAHSAIIAELTSKMMGWQAATKDSASIATIV